MMTMQNTSDDHLVEHTLDHVELLKGHFLHAFRDTVRLPSGGTATREFVIHPGAVMMSLIGAFYYLRIVKVMYFDAPITATTVSAGNDVRVVLTINGALILILGILPGGLMALCANAIVRTLGT